MKTLETRLKIEAIKREYWQHGVIKNACNTMLDELDFIEEYINSLNSDELDFQQLTNGGER